MAYQSGWTILAYNTKAIDRPIDSWLDLWDPAFKGKVGMMSIPSETGAMTLVAMGKNPSTSTPADWRAAAMCIPYTAHSPLDAMTYMDFTYRPDVQAMMDNYINYVSSVPAAKEIILSKYHSPQVANSPWVFTSAEFEKLARFYPQWKDVSQVTLWNKTFEPIFES